MTISRCHVYAAILLILHSSNNLAFISRNTGTHDYSSVLNICNSNFLTTRQKRCFEVHSNNNNNINSKTPDGAYYSNKGRNTIQFSKENTNSYNDFQNKSHPPSYGHQNTNRNWLEPEQVQKLKESIDIISFIESFDLPQFERKGDNRAVALCPFHNDNNPSLSIDGDRQLYKCFACGAGGDVFNWVREYNGIHHHLDSGTLSFAQAVQYVANEYSDDHAPLGRVLNGGSGGIGVNRMNDDERRKLNEQKEQILLANAIAAEFYGKSITALNTAGVARSHLQSRGLSPDTVRTFAIGWAPDVYYGDSKKYSGKKWGDGSLVNHLQKVGFSPDEIVDAGLAFRTKNSNATVVTTTQNVANGEESHDNSTTRTDSESSNIMDRFRDRLVVPIFDSKGKNVLGFGGRILEMPNTNKKSQQTTKTTAKYINTPSTLVFQKKNVLFGQHSAREAITASSNPNTNVRTIVIVEGYMDVITLSEVGIKEVVACMGTSLSDEQLAAAAKTVGTPRGGRIILCLDGDNAGMIAVERLCKNKALQKLCEVYSVEVLVATLPEGIKDPGEFVENRGVSTRSGEAFRKEVLDTAQDWTRWYSDRIFSQYNATAAQGSKGSFADMCERISEFLSTFRNAADRTKRAFDAAGILSKIIAKESSSPEESSSALQIQLESDLISMTSRKAIARERTNRRMDFVPGGLSLLKDTRTGIDEVLNTGGSSEIDFSKLSGQAVKAIKQAESPPSFPNEQSGRTSAQKWENSDLKKKWLRGTRHSMRRKSSGMNRDEPQLTPHFSGFEFENQSDAAWMGITKNKRNRKGPLTLGTQEIGASETRAKFHALRNGHDYIPGLTQQKQIYFNSNEYHGNSFLTEEASQAGYSNNREVPRDALLFVRGVSSLLVKELDTIIASAEDSLLSVLIQYEPARVAMKASLASSAATGAETHISWSSQDRSWLFERLTSSEDEIFSELIEGGKLEELRSYLATCPDTPPGAFSQSETGGVPIVDPDYQGVDRNIVLESNETSQGIMPVVGPGNSIVKQDGENIKDRSKSAKIPKVDMGDFAIVDYTPLNGEAAARDNSVEYPSNSASLQLEGSLDYFFNPVDDLFSETYDASIPRETRAELTAQEALSTLLLASAMKRLDRAKSNWFNACQILSHRLDQSTSNQVSSEDGDVVFTDDDVLLQSMELSELRNYTKKLATKVKDASHLVEELEASAKRMGSRVIDYCSTDSFGSKVSTAKQEILAKEMDEFIDSLPEDRIRPNIPGSDENYVFGMDQFDDSFDSQFGGQNEDGLSREEQLEADLDRIDSEWSNWSDNGTPQEPNPDTFFPSAEGFQNDEDDFEEEEDLDIELARIEAEWSEWTNDEPELANESSSEASNNVYSSEFFIATPMNEEDDEDNVSTLDFY